MSETSRDSWRSAAAGIWPGHSELKKLGGQPSVPQIFLIIQWPSKEVAMAFYECDEYRLYRQNHMEGARNEFLIVAGEDMTKTAQIAE
jgi:hypothetical protein